MSRATENCLAIMRTALAQAQEWEAQREPAHADILGQVATFALATAINCDAGGE